MARKKRADMTPMERMENIMTGAKWDDGCDRRLRNSGIEGKYVVLNM